MDTKATNVTIENIPSYVATIQERDAAIQRDADAKALRVATRAPKPRATLQPASLADFYTARSFQTFNKTVQKYVKYRADNVVITNARGELSITVRHSLLGVETITATNIAAWYCEK